jgi:hypothetical protein
MKSLIVGLITAMALPGVASAQDVWGWSIIVPSVTQTDILGMRLRDLRMQSEARAGGAAKPRTAPAIPPGSDDQASKGTGVENPSVLRYVPSRTRRRANLADFLAKSRQADPAGAASLDELFAQGDIIERFGQLLAPHGLRVDDVGDAYALWWMSAWQATHGVTDSPGDRATRAVQIQAGRALAATPELAGAGDGPKQKLAEALLIQAALLDAAVVQAKGDPVRLKAVAAAAALGARGMGMDMAAMTLTETGFVPRKRD